MKKSSEAMPFQMFSSINGLVVGSVYAFLTEITN